MVNVKIDARKGTTLSVDALLDFSVNVTLDGEPLTEAELERLLESVGGLVALKGKWVEVDRDKLDEALKHWKKSSATPGKAAFRSMKGCGSWPECPESTTWQRPPNKIGIGSD